MANFVYDKARQKFLEGSIAWLTDTIRVQLINTNPYVAGVGDQPFTALVSHEFLSSVPSSARVHTPQVMGSKTSTNGNADTTADMAFTNVQSIPGPGGVGAGDIDAYIIYKDTGNEATSPLIAYIDTVAVNPQTGQPGLPIIPNGGTINLLFGGTRIFRI